MNRARELFINKIRSIYCHLISILLFLLDLVLANFLTEAKDSAAFLVERAESFTSLIEIAPLRHWYINPTGETVS